MGLDRNWWNISGTVDAAYHPGAFLYALCPGIGGDGPDPVFHVPMAWLATWHSDLGIAQSALPASTWEKYDIWLPPLLRSVLFLPCWPPSPVPSGQKRSGNPTGTGIHARPLSSFFYWFMRPILPCVQRWISMSKKPGWLPSIHSSLLYRPFLVIIIPRYMNPSIPIRWSIRR